VVANPRQVRDFAKATGQLAKTDDLDAALLALFADRVRPTPRSLPDATVQALDALITRRRQLLDMLTPSGIGWSTRWARFGAGSPITFGGSSDGSPTSIVTSIRRSPPALPGARKTTSCRVSRVSGPW